VENSRRIIEYIFTDIMFESNSDKDEGKSDYNRTINLLKNYKYLNYFQRENFLFIGTKAFKNENEIEHLHFEVFGRYCNLFKKEEEEEDNFEFLFNDVSKTKIKEEINAEMKYKTIFLSKVAHEFKNPLICMSELIDQVSEKLNHVTNNSVTREFINQCFTQLKSISEYLLILVKDLDFFSLSYSGNNNSIKLEKENIELNKVIKYCENMTNVLLKKYQKENSIKFKISCPQELYKKAVYTDELRLKQVLINLLSNSVKYTYYGFITLEIGEEDEKIIFTVNDTGKGLTAEQLTNLNRNNFNNREISASSSGLGLSIIKEILNQLESQLIYESNEGCRSKFSFSIKNGTSNKINNSYDENLELNNSVKTDSTVLVKNIVPLNKNERVLLEISKHSVLNESNVNEFKNKLEEKNEANVFNTILEHDTDYYLVVDDEKITRKATVRVINNYFHQIKSQRKQIIFEGTDGIECLYYYLLLIKKGIKLSFIVSDQAMSFLDGLTCSKILKELISNKGLKPVPFYILSAYESLNLLEENKACNFFTKPLTPNKIQEMLSNDEKLLKKSNTNIII